MNTFIELPAMASADWKSPVATFADLPTSDPVGSVRLVEGDSTIYWWDGANWNGITAAVSTVDTNSIDLAVIAGVLSGNVRLSSNAAAAGNTIVPINIESASSVGLRAQVANADIRGLLSNTAPIGYNSSTGAISITQSTTSTNGYLSSTDWNTFNNKQDGIVATTTADYYRGDKTFQLLQMSALTATTAGSAATTGAIGEVLTATQASNTGTGVGSTGAWGSPISISLTAGAWQVFGVAGFSENGADLTTALQCGISDSATGVGISEFDTSLAPFQISGASDALIATPNVFVNISSPTTYYLNTLFTYTSGTPEHRGKITALRLR